MPYKIAAKIASYLMIQSLSLLLLMYYILAHKKLKVVKSSQYLKAKADVLNVEVKLIQEFEVDRTY